MIELLSARRQGLTAAQIMQRTGVTHSTLYRDLAELREAGVPLESHTVNGEARHTLFGRKLPPLGPTALQISALRLARRRARTRTRIRYRAVRAATSEWRTVDPLGLRYAKGNLYFLAYRRRQSDRVVLVAARARAGAARHLVSSKGARRLTARSPATV